MKKVKNIVAAIATISALCGVTSAQATIQNWYVDTDGAGGNVAVLVNDYLDLNGRAYVKNTFTSATNFSFNEVASLKTVLADGVTLLSPTLTSSFFGTGSGTTGGALSFSSGTLTVMSGASTVGQFTLVDGSANLLANSTLPNGTVSLIFKATSLMSGYFFDSGMQDLANVVTAPGGLLMGFATTNAIDLSKDKGAVNGNVNVDASLVTAYNNQFGTSFGVIDANQTTDLMLSNNGQFRMEVPEPTSIALIGLGLLGLARSQRSKKSKQA